MNARELASEIVTIGHYPTRTCDEFGTRRVYVAGEFVYGSYDEAAAEQFYDRIVLALAKILGGCKAISTFRIDMSQEPRYTTTEHAAENVSNPARKRKGKAAA